MLQWRKYNTSFYKKDFIKNTIALVTGTGLSQLLTLGFSPLLTRIYSPTEFGSLAIVISLCSIISIISTGRYELSIMLPKNDYDAFNLLVLSFISALATSIIMFIFLFLFDNYLLRFFNGAVSQIQLWFIPAGTFFLACFQTLSFWLSRQEKYRVISSIRILQSIIIVVLSISIGFSSEKANGLIYGYIIGSSVGILPLMYIIYRRRSRFSKKHMMRLAQKYISYPKIMMATAFMDTFAMQAPVFFITKYFSPIILGSYSLAFRIVTSPLALISGAIGQVFFQKITSTVNGGKDFIYPIIINTAKRLLLISMAIFLPILFFGRDIFEFVFGVNWIEAGEYVEIISIAMMVRFVVSPLSNVFISTSNFKIAALWQASYFFSTVVIFFLGRNSDMENLLYLYVANEIILYSLYFSLMVMVSKKFDSSQLCVD